MKHISRISSVRVAYGQDGAGLVWYRVLLSVVVMGVGGVATYFGFANKEM